MPWRWFSFLCPPVGTCYWISRISKNSTKNGRFGYGPRYLLAAKPYCFLFLWDTSRKRLKPKTAYLNFYFYHSLVFSLLSFAALWSLSTVMLLGGIAEIRLMNFNNNGIDSLCWILGLWLLWGCLFYLYYRESSELITRLITWLLRAVCLSC